MMKFLSGSSLLLALSFCHQQIVTINGQIFRPSSVTKYVLALSAILAADTVNGQTFPACDTGTFDPTAPLSVSETYFSSSTIYRLICQQPTSNAAPLDPSQYFTEFCNALNRFPNLVMMLNNNSTGTIAPTGTQFTVFAPVNSAFTPITNILGNLTPNQLRRLLELHIYVGNMPLSELYCGRTIDSINTQAGFQGGSSSTQCSGHAGVGGQFQVGPCNGPNELAMLQLPRIGSADGSNPPFVFQKSTESTTLTGFTNDEARQGGYGPGGRTLPNAFNVNAPTCNGLIHALSQVMLPANTPGCSATFPSQSPSQEPSLETQPSQEPSSKTQPSSEPPTSSIPKSKKKIKSSKQLIFK